jgi:predicted O-linked N-acetylglucosamine transferase (SPINDLY family)
MMNAGLPDWVATDPEDYLGKALLHANDLQALANLRISLRQQVLTSPIFDAPRFAQHLLAALRAMWTQWCAQPSDEVIQPQKVPDGTV